ncbi:MAG: hypothetical protein QME61_01130 [Patescibacteria group bacterium]|nr:hypothetical protein [Patescibacteria group bacterium]
MQVFEFHFNPKASEDIIFDSFCYEPENIYEKRLGSLFVVGELRNVLPQNLKFLDNFVDFLKKEYYSAPIKLSPEASLKESLKKSNEFLEEIAKKGNLSWLGNLNLAILSLKDFKLNFTKIGDLKIFLLRGNQITDIGKNLEFSGIESIPLKTFGNIVSGKLAEEDKILVLTEEVAEFFSAQNLFLEIGKITPFNEKNLKEILKTKKGQLSKISGICLLIVLTKEILPQKREIISQPQLTTKILIKNFIQIFGPIMKKAKLIPYQIFGKLKFPKITLPSLKLKISKIKVPNIEIKAFLKKKNTILILTLIFFLLLGFFIFQKEKEEKLKEYQSILNNIQEKILQAENFLIFKEEEKAQILFKEAWQEILPLTKINSTLSASLSNQILSLENRIEKNLNQLNRLEKIEEPNLLLEFNPREFIPQKIIFFNQNLYLFSPYSQNLFELKPNGQRILIKKEEKFDSAASIEDSILFFSKPNQLTILRRGKQFSFFLEKPNFDFNFEDFSTYKSNLYFLDPKSGEIIKYPYLGNFNWGPPQLWLNKRIINGESMAVDGAIWILNKDNSINKYYVGNLQEKIELNIFPPVKDFSKIFTSPLLPYLYILEPLQNRIIILDKSGRIIKQFQSKKFDNLLDFAVSEDGKEIYLLNGLKSYVLGKDI